MPNANLEENLRTAFQQFIAHDVSNDVLLTIKQQVSASDLDALVASVESLGDPSDHCVDEYDTKAPEGFFLYVDFVSALIINLGGAADEALEEFRHTQHPFVKWVVRYAGDPRFHDEIMSKFVAVFDE